MQICVDEAVSRCWLMAIYVQGHKDTGVPGTRVPWGQGVLGNPKNNPSLEMVRTLTLRKCLAQYSGNIVLY